MSEPPGIYSTKDGEITAEAIGASGLVVAYIPGGGEVGGDEEEVAGGAEHERPPGPHRSHHRRTHDRERRERRVQQAQRYRPQIAVLRARARAAGANQSYRHATDGHVRPSVRACAGEFLRWEDAYRVDGALEVLGGVVGEEDEEEGQAEEVEVAGLRRCACAAAAVSGGGDEGSRLLVVVGRRELGSGRCGAHRGRRGASAWPGWGRSQLPDPSVSCEMIWGGKGMGFSNS